MLNLALDNPVIFQCPLVFMPGQGGKTGTVLVSLSTWGNLRSAGLVSSEE